MTAQEEVVGSVQPRPGALAGQAMTEHTLAHGGRIVPRNPGPGEPVTLVFIADAAQPVDLVAVYYTTDGSEPLGERGRAIHGAVVEAEAGPRETDPLSGCAVREWRARLPGQPDGTLVQYRAEGWNVRGARRSFAADGEAVAGGGEARGPVFAFSVDTMRAPDWLEDAVLYRLVVDGFSLPDAETVSPGSLMAVRGQLDYIQALGATCMWLSPLLASAGLRPYDPLSFYSVAERYGGNEALDRLIHEAHERELKVILDFVVGHTSTEHPLFLRARRDPQGALSEWFRGSDGAGPPPRNGAGAAILATDHPDVRRYLLTAAQFWLSELGADGLAFHDLAGPSPAFWTWMRREIRRNFPSALLLGAPIEPPRDVAGYAGRVDAMLDLELAEHLRRVFATRAEPLEALLRSLDERAARPDGLARATPLDGPEMPRFLALAGGETARLRLALACQMTLEGTPVLYYGTEVGLTQTVDAAGQPAPMRWDEAQDRGLLSAWQMLAALRRGHPALRHGTRVGLPVEVVSGPAEARAQVGAYLRSTDAEYLVVALNNAQAPVTVRIRLAQALGPMSGGTEGTALGHRFGASAGSSPTIQRGAVEVALPPLAVAVLGRQ